MSREFEENFAKPSWVWSFNLSKKKGNDRQRTIVFYKFPWRASSEVRDQFLLHANTNKHTYPALYKYIFRFWNTVVYIIVSCLWSGYSGQNSSWIHILPLAWIESKRMETSQVIRLYSACEVVLEYSIVTAIFGCILVLSWSAKLIRTAQNDWNVY